jgi:uncharacterized Zn finger protein
MKAPRKPPREPHWFQAQPKKPPPEHGIRIKKAGVTWWGQRWIEALTIVLGADAGRLARGRTYARAGRTHDLVARGGTVTAKVTGSRSTPYEVEIRVAQLSDAAWRAAIAEMAAKAQFAAALLAGQMPAAIGEVFRERDAALFPARRSDLRTQCTCPDWGDPCKHVAATHYVLGEALDRDPFLLFELRGRSKSQVLQALRAARAGAKADQADEAAASRGEAAGDDDEPGAKVSLANIGELEYDKPRAAFPALHFSFQEPVAHGAVLRQLGSPSAWRADASPLELLAPLVRAAAAEARKIALAESAAPAAPVERGDKPASSAPAARAEATRPVAKRKSSRGRSRPSKR